MKLRKSLYFSLWGISAFSASVFAANVAPSMTPPGGIPVDKAPLFVGIGWDDNTDSAGIAWARSLFDGIYNLDGTPASSSFYMNSSTLSYDNALVNELNKLATSNHEIGNHTWDHQAHIAYRFDPEKGASSTLGWNSMTQWLRNGATTFEWKKLLQKGADFLGLYTNIKPDALKGFRAPYLEFGKGLFPALKEMGMRYDCSVEEYSDGNGKWNWPYTLDNGAPTFNNRVWKSNPTNTIDLDGNATTKDDIAPYYFNIPEVPGLWELPVYGLLIPDDMTCSQYGIKPGLRQRIWSKLPWMANSEDTHIAGYDYNLWSEAELNKDEVLGILKYNLDLRIAGNRAPFLFGAHSQYYVGDWASNNAPNATAEEMRSAIEEFINYAKSKPMVRLVSLNTIIDWMENPTEISTTFDNGD